jgi:hypothetical protein
MLLVDGEAVSFSLPVLHRPILPGNGWVIGRSSSAGVHHIIARGPTSAFHPAEKPTCFISGIPLREVLAEVLKIATLAGFFLRMATPIYSKVLMRLAVDGRETFRGYQGNALPITRATYSIRSILMFATSKVPSIATRGDEVQRYKHRPLASCRLG